jgi:hypothetical protein
MTSSDDPTVGPRGAVQAGQAAADPEAMRRLAERLHHDLDQAFDEWGAGANANAVRERARPEAPTFARPVTAPPVRMEQLARTPEPTADLDDLVDLLVPRLLEKLVPALREALRDDD